MAAGTAGCVMTFYNTSHTLGDELRKYQTQAASQEATLLRAFIKRWKRPMTPTQARLAAGLDQAPITSIRRAITNLTTAGELEKTTQQRRGPYNRPEYLWRAAEKHRFGQQQLI